MKFRKILAERKCLFKREHRLPLSEKCRQAKKETNIRQDMFKEEHGLEEKTEVESFNVVQTPKYSRSLIPDTLYGSQNFSNSDPGAQRQV